MQHLFRKMFEIYHVDQNIDYPYTDSGISYLKDRIRNGIAFVARDGEKRIGFTTGAIEDTLPFKSYRQHGHLHNLFVLEAYRNMRIGRRLVERFIQRCAEDGVQRIMTDSDDIESLRRFYTSLGFRITGVNYELIQEP